LETINNISNSSKQTRTADEYYRLLNEFTTLCDKLVTDGFQYLVVNLCHELYRYLYPTEPYTDFKNQNPVNFITDHIRKLIDLGNIFSQSVVPYDLTISKSSGFNNEQLEKETSDLYSSLWKEFNTSTLSEESHKLISLRIPDPIIKQHIINKKVLDMGCGSGRFCLALAKLGARHVVGVDFQKKSFDQAKMVSRKLNFPIDFQEENVLNLSLENDTFDFVFCNGVLHHTHSIQKGLEELFRVLKPSGKSFLYLYAAKGVFWETRKALRKVFKTIPVQYTQSVLRNMGMPANRFIFCDTWYVPVEIHTTTEEIQTLMRNSGFNYEKIVGQNSYDLDKAIQDNIKDAKLMWGDGEHRYIIWKE